MTKDDIIDWVSYIDHQFLNKKDWNAFDKYEAFAKLVAAAEREACAKVCEELAGSKNLFSDAIRARSEK